MNTKLATDKALAVIDQYLNFRIAGATCSIPYFNNRHTAVRAGLRAVTGKGSPRDIFDEVEIASTREHADLRTMTGETLRAFLVNHNIGIDCSGFVYYVLGAESAARGKGALDRNLSFPFSSGIIGKIRSKMRPAENADVQTFASEKNSRVIEYSSSEAEVAAADKCIEPGDIITMTAGPADGERDHILFIHQVEYQNFVPTTIRYTHAMAWPSDGEYGHGVRQGVIEILNPNKSLIEQKWIEAGKSGGAAMATSENYTFVRAAKSTTQVRRLNWF